MIPRTTALLLIPSVAILLSGCLQFETPHTFMEDEEVKIRAKNLSRYYQDLEEQIRREQYHIKLLEGTLHINLTSEQTLSEQVKKKQQRIGELTTDNNVLEGEIKSLENDLKGRQDKRKGLQGSLDAEKQKTAEIEKSIALESGRIGDARARLRRTADELKRLEEQARLQEEALKKKKETEAKAPEK